MGYVPVEDVAKLPPPGAAVPTSIAFSPDDRLVTFLHSDAGTLSRELYGVDVETGARRPLLVPPGDGDTEENLSREEKLRRERARDLGVGVTSYQWADNVPRLLVPLGGAVYIKDGADSLLRELIPRGDSPALDPRLSRDGSHVAFVRDGELYVVDADGPADPLQVTTGGRNNGVVHGLAEFIAQEEMGRYRGHWWSMDGRSLAFTEVDESAVPILTIQHLGADRIDTEEHRYPFAGEANASVRLGVVPVGGGSPVWLDLGGDDRYLARVHWLPDGELVAEVQDRDQQTLDVCRFDPSTGQRHTVITEHGEPWINLHNGFRALDGGGFLWLSERTGFRHVYRVDAHGDTVAVTSGSWMVDDVAAVDEAAGLVWFTGTLDGPTERHLYVVPLAGDRPPRRITAGAGMHTVVVDHGRQRFVDVHSRASEPPTVTLCRLRDGADVHRLHAQPDPRADALGLRPPAIETFTSRDGVTLYGAVYEPDASVYGPPPYPLVVAVYGGPHVQLVTDEWRTTAAMRAQHLRGKGFLVAVVDNRGSARRGLEFEAAVHRNLGSIEVEDQVDGVKWLVERGLADPDRVAIYGWSYGGYMALMCLAQAPDVFRAAVAGAPVTHWDGYDTHYTERYMGTPASNPDGYERSSVMHHAAAIRGRLLLVHGLVDENVHFRHTARLINALIRERVPYELLLFPDERHTPRGEADRVFMEERISAFLTESLTAGDGGGLGAG